MTSQDRQNEKTRQWQNALIIGFILLILVIYSAFCIGYGFFVLKAWPNLSDAGNFGDMYGAFNAFVSGIAMMGVVVAIYLQKRQNTLQANELKQQKRELQRAASAHQQQVRMLAMSAYIHAQAVRQAGGYGMDLDGVKLYSGELKKILEQTHLAKSHDSP